MDKMQELNMDTMEQVTGGVQRTVNTGINGKHGVVRAAASTESAWVTALPNGTVVDTVTDQLVYDPYSRRNFVQINYTKDGQSGTGWIAASIIGMPRGD